MDNRWGGGLWPSENPNGLKNQLKEIKIARKLGTKTCLYGIDINSINQEESKMAWKSISEQVDFIICRNDRTTKMLNALGCRNATRASDLTFGLTTDAEQREDRACLEKLGIEEKKYVIWAVLMPWPTWEYEEQKHGERYHLLVNQLQTIANMPQYQGLKHVFMPFHYQMEMPIIQDIRSGIHGRSIVCDDEKGLDIGEKRLLFRYAKQCVSMKFHGAMFAIYHGTPTAIVSYSDKTSDVLKEMGLHDYYIEYGIRETQDFYKCFDLDMESIRNIVTHSCQDQATLDFKAAEVKLKEMSKNCKRQMLFWLK